MKNSVFSKMGLLALVAIFFFSSCDDKEDVKKELSCNEKATAYNAELEAVAEAFADEENLPSCDETKAKVEALTAAYENLCPETRTDEVDEDFVELVATIAIYAAFTDCDIE